MTVKEAREILGLGLTATRQEIVAAYRRQARRWHPDRAPTGEEEVYRGKMQEVNAAYHRLKQMLDRYRYRLEDAEPPDDGQDYQKWWHARFFSGVWSAPPKKPEGNRE
jgi:DnaJ-class molecular chaperone|uniref:J domain-containing protein n=1 Tax=Desulfobacca acetoxidans TaxID=60893 RepID=A0A7C3SI67_9BACT